MKLDDNLFKKIERKTNVDKNTILSLADKLQNGNMKDERTLKDIIQTLSKATGKNVTDEQSDKIVNKILKDEVPNNMDKMF
ncbi:MAG: stage VI sporulation protein F [bacterium]